MQWLHTTPHNPPYQPGMLTPIRVRGRRKQPPHAAHPNNASQQPPASQSKGGRPLLSPQERLNLSQTKTTKRARFLVAQPSTKPWRKRSSLLEALPVELIEKVFLYSLNVNLPRASAVLAAAVSSERVYRALTLLSFWDDSSAYNTLSAGSRADDTVVARILRPFDYAPISYEERLALQGAVLRCRWCTMERVLGQLPELMNLSIQRHWMGAGISMDRDEEDRLGRFLAREEDARSFAGTDKNGNTYTLEIAPLISIKITCHETDAAQTHRVLGILHFPEKLLTGTENGFSADAATQLEIFRIASGFAQEDLVHSDIRISREAIQTGIHTALTTRNKDALASLLKLDEYLFRSQSTPETTPPTTQQPFYTLPPSHFRTAIHASPTDPTLFHHLLRTNTESIPPDDPEITQWAVDMNNAFGRWLLDLMLRYPQRVEAARADPVNGGAFYMGRANAQVEDARAFLGILGVAELGCWMGELGVDVGGLWVL